MIKTGSFTPKNQEILSNTWGPLLLSRTLPGAIGNLLIKMNYNKKYTKSVFFFLEILLLTLSYSVVYWLKTGAFYLARFPYDLLLIIYIVVWLLLSIYHKKFESIGPSTFQQGFILLLNQSTFMLLFLALLCSFTSFHSVSRLFLIKIVYLPTLIELFAGLIVKKVMERNQESTKTEKVFHATEKVSAFRVAVSGLILTTVFIGRHLLGYVNGQTSEGYEHTVLLLTLSWTISSSLTGKFKPHSGQNLYYKIAPFIKSDVIMILICAAAYYFGRFENLLIQYDLFMTAVTFSSIEISLALLYFGYLEKTTPSFMIHSVSHFGQADLVDVDVDVDVESMLKQLESIKHENEEAIRDSIKSFFRENHFNPPRFKIFYHRQLANIQLFKPASRDCMLNYYLINDIEDLNAYFQACYHAVSAQGYLMGLYTPQDIIRIILESKMPRSLFVVYYPFYYVIKRIIPKLPWIGGIYSTLTRGKHKLISKAELWGRLAYAGFSVKQESKLNGKVLFIAQKKLTPAEEEYPSYGPLIKLKRVGFRGEIIRIYKLRTMHPYSEFIQKEVYQQNSLDKSGKLNNDFRRNGVGMFLRKFWLDEFPQLYNWIKGDLGLVGVRALSDHYLSLYPPDLRELRKQYKPGLLPPYYADLPKSLDEIIESERQYLNKKHEHPFKTDIIYLYKIFVNIIFRGARSG